MKPKVPLGPESLEQSQIVIVTLSTTVGLFGGFGFVQRVEKLRFTKAQLLCNRIEHNSKMLKGNFINLVKGGARPL